MFTWSLELKLNSILTDKEWTDFAGFMNHHPTIGNKIIEIMKANPVENRVSVPLSTKELKLIKNYLDMNKKEGWTSNALNVDEYWEVHKKLWFKINRCIKAR